MLIGLLGVDVGLQTALWFGTPMRNRSPEPEPENLPNAGPAFFLYTPLITRALTVVVLGY
jgi:hypothetical protein